MEGLQGIVDRFSYLTREEMIAQVERERGSFADAIKGEANRFANKTDNVEAMMAIWLTDFYFPNLNPKICFEMKNDFSPNKATAYDVFLGGIEKNTVIDCSIKGNVRQFNFQIKRYPQEYLPLTNEAVAGYIKKTIATYGSMKGIILIILLQPNTETPNDFSFRRAHEDLLAIKDNVTFDEINFIFNERLQIMRWQQIFPQYGYADRPLILLSDFQKARQREWGERKFDV